MQRDTKIGLFVVGSLVSIVALLILSPFTIISAGERGVVLHFGNVDRVLAEGIHWVTPLVESVQTMDVTTQKAEVSATAASKDLQTVSAKVAINYNIQGDKVGEIYKTFQHNYDEILIAPAIQEAVKAATAKYTAEELITKREAVKMAIMDSLKDRLSTSFVIITGVSITDFDFSAEFNKSIESKVKAEQDALTAKNKLEQVKYEAEQSIAKAQAEAQSIRLQSEAANNEKYVHLKEIEVRLEMSKKWNGVLPVNMYANVPLPLLDITK
jgi:regulator of protease activity HflC (stomatin/prohibitin superfamily)